jgi:hypothetical protein
MIKICIPFLYVSLIYFLGCCPKTEDSLEIIRKFKPEDKYFKANFVSLHFLMETSPIPRVDSTFNQIVAGYDLPISALIKAQL